ncbi:M23 family metallopeptidase [Siccirubricoccus deserti]
MPMLPCPDRHHRLCRAAVFGAAAHALERPTAASQLADCDEMHCNAPPRLPSWTARQQDGPRMRLSPVVVAVLLLTATGAQAERCAAPLPTGAGIPPTSINPLIVRPLGETIIPVPATDGLIHLAYAAQTTNLAAGPARISSILPVDPLRGFEPTGRNLVLNVEGAPITGEVRVFGTPPASSRDTPTLAAGTSGITFFDVTYARLAEVPELVAHRVSVGFPEGTSLTTITDPVRVNCDGPVQLSPPLSGRGWWNGNGCCRTVNAHRSATLPLNGDLRPPEQFAIDFMQVTPDGGCCTGPVSDLRSWPFHGVPVLAAAAGTVVAAVDDMPDQIPGPPQGVTVENAPGNHVIQDIGGGRWVLYAHLSPGSVTVKPGDVLRPGQPLGKLGNRDPPRRRTCIFRSWTARRR